MQIPNSKVDETAVGLIALPAARQPTMVEELNDWNAYYRLLLAGKLGRYVGQFIVVYDGVVIGQGTDSDVLRAKVADQIGVAKHRLVVPFVDHQECIVAE